MPTATEVKGKDAALKRAIDLCRERKIVIPTFAQLKDPGLIPPSALAKLKGVGLWDVNPLNLFRITWHNDVKTGLFGGVNCVDACLQAIRRQRAGSVGVHRGLPG